jgi:hypothetical protein
MELTFTAVAFSCPAESRCAAGAAYMAARGVMAERDHAKHVLCVIDVDAHQLVSCAAAFLDPWR